MVVALHPSSHGDPSSILPHPSLLFLSLALQAFALAVTLLGMTFLYSKGAIQAKMSLCSCDPLPHLGFRALFYKYSSCSDMVVSLPGYISVYLAPGIRQEYKKQY